MFEIQAWEDVKKYCIPIKMIVWELKLIPIKGKTDAFTMNYSGIKVSETKT